MKLLIAFLIILSGYSSATGISSDESSQRTIYKSWVLSRCLSDIVSGADKKDYFNTSSAYLEMSSLPVEAFIRAEHLIKQFLSRTYSGSIPGTFESKKCIDLFNSEELDDLYTAMIK